ncbi:unnamed protein product [Scytosiphon promiscuus]
MRCSKGLPRRCCGYCSRVQRGAMSLRCWPRLGSKSRGKRYCTTAQRSIQYPTHATLDARAQKLSSLLSRRTVAISQVILFNPGFPWYLSTARVVGATPVLVELAGPDFAPDMEKLEEAITPKTKVLLINTPHNPCGHCYTKEEIEGFARLAQKHNLFVISDEVYENVTFGGTRHHRIADEEGMFERTVTLCSASKLFSLTGWRVGWALSTPGLLKGLAVYHGNTSYCAPSPLQHGLAVALGVEDGSFEGIPKLVEGNAELLGNALEEKGFAVTQPQGGHFLVADTTPLGLKGLECAKLLLTHAKVGVVPGVIFYFPDNTGVDPDRPLLRFAICKRRDTIEEAVRRIREMDFPAPTPK